MTREEIQAIYTQGPEAVIAVIERLEAAMAELSGRVKELEGRLALDSRNSGKPPSSDGYGKKTHSLRGKSGRRAGGQKGHPGTTLKQVERPDVEVEHKVEACGRCGTRLDGVAAVGEERRQVFDVPPVRLEVTEHRAERKVCPRCGDETVGAFPADVTNGVQYGSGIKAAAAYLMTGHMVSVSRTAEILEDLLGCPMSVGTLMGVMDEGRTELAETEAAIKAGVCATPTVHYDETGFRVNGKLHWLHVAGTTDLTYYAVHPGHGTAAMDEIGVLPNHAGVAVHDALAAYLSYEGDHALCNAHLLRELIFVHEHMGQAWAGDFITFLRDAKRAVEQAVAADLTALPADALARFEAKYDRLAAQGLALPENALPFVAGSRGRPKQSKSKNLLDRLTTHKAFVLAFLRDFRVPFDNNRAERDLRMMKLKQKVSGGFRTADGAAAFACLRGFISTLKKQGRDVFAALKSVFAGCPVNPLPTG